jgi:long-chain acyl-CoA synthetase
MVNWVLRFEAQVHAQGRKTALICDGVRYSYAQLNRDAARFGRWLLGTDVERVGIVLPNTYEFVVTQMGALKAGLVTVPINYMAGRDMIRSIVDSGDIGVLVTDTERATEFGSPPDDSPLEVVLSTSGSTQSSRAFWTVVNEQSDLLETVPRDDDDLLTISFTSGTTGSPKGVRRTHRNVSAQVLRMQQLWKMTPDDLWLCPAPVYHSAGLEGALLPVLQAGGTIIIQQWDVDEFFDLVNEYQVDSAYIAGSMLSDIYHHDGGTAGLGPLKDLFTGGGPMSTEQCDTVAARFDVRVSERMGMTEAGLTLGYPVGDRYRYTPREEQAHPRVSGSSGRVLTHGMSYRVVDLKTGGESQTGELQLTGDSIFDGYLDDPRATADAFTDDGWYRTGDVVRVDDDGYVYHVDRADNLIVSGGENVSPRKVEDVLRTHSAVEAAVVLGLPDDHWGHRVCAVVAADTDVQEADLISFCKAAEQLAAYEVPKAVWVRTELPVDASGHPDRQTLAEAFASRTDGA